MSCLEGSNFGFLLFQFGAGIRELAIKESRRALGMLLLVFQIFIDKKRRKFIVYLLCKFRRPAGVLDLESSQLSLMDRGDTRSILISLRIWSIGSCAFRKSENAGGFE